MDSNVETMSTCSAAEWHEEGVGGLSESDWFVGPVVHDSELIHGWLQYHRLGVVVRGEALVLQLSKTGRH